MYIKIKDQVPCRLNKHLADFIEEGGATPTLPQKESSIFAQLFAVSADFYVRCPHSGFLLCVHAQSGRPAKMRR